MVLATTKTSAILDAIRADLEQWAQPQNGFVSLAQNPFEVVELLANTNSGFRIIVHFDSDVNNSPLVNHQATVATVTMKATLAVSQGFDWRAWNSLVKAQQTAENQPATLDLRDNLRAYILAMRFPVVDNALPIHRGMLFYLGTNRINAPDGLPFAAWEMSFQFRHSILTLGATHEVQIQ